MYKNLETLPLLTASDLGHPKWEKAPSDTTVLVGMSGGVDSSVTAVWLKHSGFNVIGMFMKNWEEKDENGVCQSAKEYADVIKVCEAHDIPYYSVDFVEEYRENVFSHFLEEYKLGHTPNPDILCNREIKFKVFYQKAMQLGADFLATGHYCQNKFENGQNRLVKGVDSGKDQTYFLYAINGEVLSNVIFPLGHLQKSEVRQIAALFNLATKNKKDSTGICFIGERNFRNFLSQYIESSKGEFQTLDGNSVGEHIGAVFYTTGQRKGLGLGGPGGPWFVVDKDLEKNIVFVERGTDHPALFRDELFCVENTWISQDVEFPLKCCAKIRYRQSDTECLVEVVSEDKLRVRFTRPQRAITLRQSIVFYRGDECLGGGIISEVGPSYHELGLKVD